MGKTFFVIIITVIHVIKTTNLRGFSSVWGQGGFTVYKLIVVGNWILTSSQPHRTNVNIRNKS